MAGKNDICFTENQPYGSLVRWENQLSMDINGGFSSHGADYFLTLSVTVPVGIRCLTFFGRLNEKPDLFAVPGHYGSRILNVLSLRRRKSRSQSPELILEMKQNTNNYRVNDRVSSSYFSKIKPLIVFNCHICAGKSVHVSLCFSEITPLLNPSCWQLTKLTHCFKFGRGRPLIWLWSTTGASSTLAWSTSRVSLSEKKKNHGQRLKWFVLFKHIYPLL